MDLERMSMVLNGFLSVHIFDDVTVENTAYS